MSLYISSLNSGSNANCYYIGNDTEAVLVDAGLSCRETEKRMKQLGLSMEKVKAIFVTHEHSDHITGVPGLSKKFQLPVYITPVTLEHSNIPLQPELVRSFKHGRPVTIGNLFVMPFRKKHDGKDPHSFMISGNGINVGVITDIGFACKQVIKYFSQCHAVILESNYCDDMLRNGGYPIYLQKRISSDEGHLSNAQAVELFRHYRSDTLQLLILGHLSKNNNKPELVSQLFTPHAGTTRIVIASRYEASQVFCLEGTAAIPLPSKKVKRVKNERQLSLF
ncbi:MAG: MBL fold metallo-hydrolase [Chitinophagaceae bacterium]